MSVTSLFLVLFLVLPYHSHGAPVDLAKLKRTKDVFAKMLTMSTENGRLEDLILETRKAFAKEHFGDPLESREVDINGVELLKTYQEMTVQTFVSKAYKQLSIFHAVFQNILQHWSRGSEEKRKIEHKVKKIANKVGHLKGQLRIPAVWFSSEESVDDSFSPSGIPQLTQVWTGSVFEQNKWILGVLAKFEKSMLYLLPAFNKFSK